MEKKRILIIGPTSGVGGVRTHVEQLLKLFSAYKFKVRIINGHTFETFKNYMKFRPHIVIHNLSVYPKELIRIIINRSIAFRSSTKHILHLHGGRFNELGFLSGSISTKLLTFHFPRYDRIFCLTKEQYATMLVLCRRKESIQKIFNYVEVPDHANLDKKKDLLNLLYMGRLTSKKGVMDAVEAVKRIEGDVFRLWIIGDGELENVISQINDPRIKFEGKKIGKEKYKYLKKADVFILPSIAESMPYALLEASAYGLALIGTNVGAVDQILFNKINGFFIEFGNIEMLADTIKIFIQNPALAREMGNESYKICQNFFSLDHLKKIYDDLFEKWDSDKSSIDLPILS
jgi:glycosyltransferase involved in cell wall biosynthesis